MSDNGAPVQGLVVGAGGGIGSAVVRRWSEDSRFDTVWAVSRGTGAAPVSATSLRYLSTNHCKEHIAELAREVVLGSPNLSRIVIALGSLHSRTYLPEKSLAALDPDAMQEIYRINCVLPMLWLSALVPGLRNNPDCRIAVLSARVGSIDDNHLGGWYSYRSAKAALNMGLKSASIELARRAKGVKLLAFHPGTVDTALSAPFQRGVPEGKLFSADFVAQRLDSILDQHKADSELSYLDWAGKTVPW